MECSAHEPMSAAGPVKIGATAGCFGVDSSFSHGTPRPEAVVGEGLLWALPLEVRLGQVAPVAAGTCQRFTNR